MHPSAFCAGRYAVERVLGQGGQKIVYLVRDTKLERLCALSLLGDEGLAGDEAFRLKNEARSLALAGAHPNIVTIFDLGEENGRPFLISEFISGGDLSNELSRGTGGLGVPRTIAVARDVLRALAHVHGCKIIHRDLKPNNIW